jgi:hypothetical protein
MTSEYIRVHICVFPLFLPHKHVSSTCGYCCVFCSRRPSLLTCCHFHAPPLPAFLHPLSPPRAPPLSCAVLHSTRVAGVVTFFFACSARSKALALFDAAPAMAEGVMIQMTPQAHRGKAALVPLKASKATASGLEFEFQVRRQKSSPHLLLPSPFPHAVLGTVQHISPPHDACCVSAHTGSAWYPCPVSPPPPPARARPTFG